MQVKLREHCPIKGGINGQSIGSIVSDAIIRSWLWSTATESYPWFTSVALLLVDNCPTSVVRFSTGGLLAIEDFTFNSVGFINHKGFTYLNM